jgi:hypothetical protein
MFSDQSAQSDDQHRKVQNNSSAKTSFDVILHFERKLFGKCCVEINDCVVDVESDDVKECVIVLTDLLFALSVILVIEIHRPLTFLKLCENLDRE